MVGGGVEGIGWRQWNVFGELFEIMLDKLGFVWIFWFGVWLIFVLVNMVGV